MKNKKAEEAPKPAAASAEKTAEEEKEEGEIQSKEMRTADTCSRLFLILVNSFTANGFVKFSLYLTPHLKSDSDVNSREKTFTNTFLVDALPVSVVFCDKIRCEITRKSH
jgi:hypothetical protein